MTYSNGESVSAAMLRIRGQPNMIRYNILIDEEVVIGWDNLMGGKLSKQWKIQQKAYLNRRKRQDPRAYARVQRNNKQIAKDIKEEE